MNEVEKIKSVTITEFDTASLAPILLSDEERRLKRNPQKWKKNIAKIELNKVIAYMEIK